MGWGREAGYRGRLGGVLERMAPPWAPGLEHLVQAESDYQSGRQTISVHPGSAAPAGTPGVILHSYSFSSCAPPWQSLKSRAVEPKEHSEGHGTPQGKKHRSPVSNQGGSEAGPDAACDLRATCGSTACPWSFGFVIYSPGLGGGTAPTSPGDARIPWSAARGAGWGLTAPTPRQRERGSLSWIDIGAKAPGRPFTC